MSSSLTRLLGLYGHNAAAVDTHMVPANPAAKLAGPSIQRDRWVRNGMAPNAQLMNLMTEATNQATLYRSKEVFSAGSKLQPFHSIASTSADRARWRFAFHTGPYTHSLYAIVVMRPPTGTYDHNSYTRLDIANGAGTIVASRNFIYGVDPTNGGSSGAWPYYKVCSSYVDGVAADTDYTGIFTDIDYGRVLSATVFDLQSMADNLNGHLPQNLATHSAVLDVYREKMATIMYNLWRRGAAQVFNFSVNDGTAPRTTTSATAKNLVDGTTTTVSAASPGYTLDMTGKARVSQQTTGVPVTMKAYGKVSVGADTATVKLVNSSGVAVLTATTNSTTAGWFSTTGYLPASQDKYDLMFNVTGGATASIYAVSVYEYE